MQILQKQWQKGVAKHKQKHCDIHVEGYEGRPFAGTVGYVSDTLEEQTRTVQVRVEVANQDRLLRPGMFVTAVVRDDDPEHSRDVVVLPSQAVQRIGDAFAVFIDEEPGHFLKRPVTLGMSAGGFVEVLSGLDGGETVVAEGGFVLKSELQRADLGGGHSH